MLLNEVKSLKIEIYPLNYCVVHDLSEILSRSSLSRNFGLCNPWFIHRECFNGICVDLNLVIILQLLTALLQIKLIFNDVIGYFKESCVSLPVRYAVIKKYEFKIVYSCREHLTSCKCKLFSET